jgi:2-(1,2-epoxy-1,2-dihydrophenyl)acetyl-CoA isomerase
METILVERDAGVVTVTLNRPEKRNAINTQMWLELRDALREMEANRRVFRGE